MFLKILKGTFCDELAGSNMFSGQVIFVYSGYLCSAKSFGEQHGQFLVCGRSGLLPHPAVCSL